VGFYGFVLWEASMLWVEVMGVTLVLEAEFLGSKRGY
jgi:hypothetical protein